MIPNELDFILINLCTSEIPEHIYRTRNDEGVEVLYYIPDVQLLLEKSIFELIYYYKDDVLPCGVVERSMLHSISKRLL